MHVTVNLAVLRQNLVQLKRRTPAKMCAVVKADAYGHGLCQVAACLNKDADEFAVATKAEADNLVQCGITKPITILGCVDKTVFSPYVANVTPTVAHADDVQFLAAHNYRGAVAVKLNTGMNRIGVRPDDFKALYADIVAADMQVKSVFTHFYNSNDEEATLKQFDAIRLVQRAYFSLVPQFHCCASNFLTLPEYMHMDMVRVGISLYGYGHPCVRPAMKVTTTVLQVLSVKAGEAVGYGTYTVPCDCTVAALRVGYGDGYRRKTDGEPRYISINGYLCPILGQICMDICMADVSGIPVHAGDTAVLLDADTSCEALAASYGTIPYEVLTSFTSRAERIYVGQEDHSSAFFTNKIADYLQRV